MSLRLHRNDPEMFGSLEGVFFVDVRQVSLPLLRGHFVKVFQDPRFENHG